MDCTCLHIDLIIMPQWNEYVAELHKDPKQAFKH